MAEYRYYLIPDAMTRAFPEQFEKQTPTEFFDNIADFEKRYHQLREMPYNNECTWNGRARFPYERLVVGIDRQNPDGAVAIIQVRNGINYLCDDYRGPYADRSDAQIPQMAEKLVEVIGVDRVRPHTYTQRDGYTWVQVEKDMHITEWLYAHELCSGLQFTRFLNRDGRELFQVRDGQRVIETNADGMDQRIAASAKQVEIVKKALDPVCVRVHADNPNESRSRSSYTVMGYLRDSGGTDCYVHVQVNNSGTIINISYVEGVDINKSLEENLMQAEKDFATLQKSFENLNVSVSNPEILSYQAIPQQFKDEFLNGTFYKSFRFYDQDAPISLSCSFDTETEDQFDEYTRPKIYFFLGSK